MAENNNNKKKKKDSSASTTAECANCTASDVPLQKCGRCGLVRYCSVECQKQHWIKGGHKQFCLTPNERKVQAVDGGGGSTKNSGDEEVCSVCLQPLSSTKTSTLPCTHVIHVKCLEQLQSFSDQQLCPVCRAELPSENKSKSTTSGRKCANCGAIQCPDGAPLLDCSRCKKVAYCGRDCQAEHWKKGGHKKVCKTKPQNVATKESEVSGRICLS